MSILNRPVIIFWTMLILSMVLIGMVLHIFAGAAYPLFTTDGVGFLPAAASWHLDRTLENPLYALNQVLGLDAADKRFLYYVPLYPMVLGELMSDTSIQSYYLANNVLILLTLAAYSVFWWLMSKQMTMLSWKQATLIGVLGMFALMGGLDARTGRPENLTHLLFWLVLATTFVRNQGLKPAMHGMLWALMCFTHMLGGIYLALILCAYYAHRGMSRQHIMYMVLGIASVSCFVLAISPYGLDEMLRGIVQHLGLQVHRTPPSLTGFLFSFFIPYTYTFYFFLFVGAIWASFRISRPFLKRALNPILFTLGLSCMALLIFYFSFRTTETPYNLYMLAPLFMVLVLLPFGKRWQSDGKQSRNWFWGVICLFLVLSMGFVKRGVLFWDHLTRGTPHSIAAIKMKELPWDDVSRVGVSFSLFPVIDQEHWGKIEAVSPQGFSALDSDFDLLILQQTYSGNKTPLLKEGYSLVTDNFRPVGLKFSHIKLSNSIPGYQFAVYKPTGSPLRIEMDWDK